MSSELNHTHNGEKEASSLRLIFTLGFAGFLSGLILVAAYLFTSPFIASNKAEALQRAVFEVLPGTESFKTFYLHGAELTEQPVEQPEDLVVYQGFDSLGNSTGFAIPGAIPGFQDIISGICGYDPLKQLIVGFRVLDSKETPGLGDKIFKDLSFAENFLSLKAESELEPVKKGLKTQANQVETITGATISSKAVVNLLNNSLAKWKKPIQNYISNHNDTLK